MNPPPMNRLPFRWTALWPGIAALISLSLLLAIAFALRVYRLDEQSIWLDERDIIGFIQAPSVAAYLTFIRSLGPEIMPIYFSTLYAWAHTVGTNIETLRLLSILFSLGSVAMVYVIAADIYSRKAATIAALLAAISPFHIDIAQAPRPNALIELLALISLFTLLRALRHNAKYWWGANLLVNALLVWVHAFSAFLLLAEGIFILVWDLSQRRIQRVLPWGVVAVCTVLSPYLWLHPVVSYMPESSDDFIMSIPPLKPLLADWIADDAVMLSDPFAFQGQTWPFLSAKAQSAFVAAHGVYDNALLALFAAALGWVALRLIGRLFKIGINGKPGTAPVDEALLLCFALLPLFLLVLVSFAWRPCIVPRYTSYGAYACYILLAGVLTAFRTTAWRRTGIVLVLVLYACQLSLALPAVTRTNFLSAARYIKNHIQPQDFILVKGTFISWEIFRLNFGPTPNPILPVQTFRALSQDSRAFFQTPGNENVTLWALADPFVYTFPPKQAVDACLQECGLDVERTDFPGMNGLQLFRIRPGALASTQCCEDIPAKTHYEAILEGLLQAGLPPENETNALAAIKRIADAEWPPTKFYFSLLSFALNKEGDLELAEWAARRAIQLAPEYGFTHFALALAKAEQGDIDSAKAAYDEALRIDTLGFFRYYQPLFHALYEKKDLTAAQKEFIILDDMGVYLPAILRERVGLLPGADRFPPR